MLNSPIKVGTLEVPNRVFLAPLAGVSDVPFRRICQELGAGLTFVEMLTAGSVLYSTRRSMQAMERHRDEPMLGVQVTGPSAEMVADAVGVLDKGDFDLIDINMGCPVKKVVSKGSGSAILKDLDRVSETVRRSREATTKPLSIKVRLGFERENIVIEELGQRITEAGADMFTVHGRTRSENYGTPVDYGGIEEGVSTARSLSEEIVTVGNGDIMDNATARTMQTRTGCDAVMVSRGALGNPWIFREAVTDSDSHTTPNEWLDVLLRHLTYHETFYGDDIRSAVLARKHLLWYVNGFPNIKALREELSLITDLGRAKRLIEDFVATMHPDQLRYQNEPRPETFDPKYDMDRKNDRAAADE
ncbi:MAG: tRNA-dihydrouridine synthase [Verrucomicrobiota bacterium]